MVSVFTFCLLAIDSYSQITRGAVHGELYVSGDWYLENNSILHYAILRSADNGESISLQYENLETPPPGEMKVGKVLGDATPGTLYNYGNNELWVSFDYGESWEFQENFTYASYATGFSNGEIYRRSNYNLYKSDNYGNSFDLIVESLIEPLSDVGNQSGQLYGFTGSAGIGYKLYYSQDFGNNFTMILIDSLVAFWAPSGQKPLISRGTKPGEIYLVSWTPELHYRIFHSIDTGYSWTQKFESEYIDIYYWSVQFTAGREPGSFYVMRARINPDGDHVWLYIDYSKDYGKTFTTYFHDLDSTITGICGFEIGNIKLSNYPNPFSGHTTFSFDVPANSKNPKLNIYDVYGVLSRQLSVYGKKTQVWDGTDNSGNRVKEGLYLYNISYDNYISQFNKLLIIN